MRKLFASTSIMGISTVVTIIFGVVRSKVMAVLLAPAGVGVISQAFSFFTAASTVTSLGLGAGIIKYISLYKEEKKSLLIRQVILVSFMLQMLISVLGIILVMLFDKKISLIIFSTSKYANLLIFIALAVPLTTLVYLTGSIFLAIGNVKAFAISRVFGYLAGIIPMALLIYLWRIKGGFIQIFLVSLISFLFCLYYFFKFMPAEFYLFKNINEYKGLFSMGKTIFKYGFIMLTSTALASFSILAARSLIIRSMGAVANGYYQVLVAFSAYYLPFFTNALWSHFYPQASSRVSHSELSKELSDTVRFLTIGITAVIVMLLIIKHYLVALVFSDKFSNAVPFMASQLTGDFFALLAATLGCSILARGKVKVYFFNALFTSSIFIAMTIIMLPRLGLFSVTASYIVSQLLSAILIYAYHHNYLKLRLSGNALYAILSSLFLLTFIVLLPDTPVNIYLKIFSLIFWFFITVKKYEWLAVLRLVNERWNRLTFQAIE